MKKFSERPKKSKQLETKKKRRKNFRKPKRSKKNQWNRKKRNAKT